MFDIGFFELLLILLVGLVVLGPKKLPEAVKSVSRFLLWLKRQTNKAKQEINKTFGLNEVYQDSRNEEILKDLKDSNK
jgi:sec-independent protein translocase protein TatB|tara:strand:+ start:76 stop:309 length:234 start_codon:yes stop_codon:yes gene_type:complete